jgi:hypothetical protein
MNRSQTTKKGTEEQRVEREVKVKGEVTQQRNEKTL